MVDTVKYTHTAMTLTSEKRERVSNRKFYCMLGRSPNVWSCKAQVDVSVCVTMGRFERLEWFCVGLVGHVLWAPEYIRRSWNKAVRLSWELTRGPPLPFSAFNLTQKASRFIRQESASCQENISTDQSDKQNTSLTKDVEWTALTGTLPEGFWRRKQKG